MTDQKPTGVFVPLPLSNEQLGKLLAPTGPLNERLLSIGTPVRDAELEVITTLGTLRDPVPCVRQFEAQAQIAARDAEIVRLRRVLSDIHDDYHDLPEFMRLEAIIKTAELALKGGVE